MIVRICGDCEVTIVKLLEIYKLDGVVIPTHRPIRRFVQEDHIFRTKREKYKAIIDEVVYLHEQDLPVLVGTVSVEVSELLSRMLTRKGIKPQLLNARYHEKEAQIITQAGAAGTVTIATNIAGRGTDLKLVSSVIRLDRDIIDSQLSLDSRLKSGTSLRDHLVEEPGAPEGKPSQRRDRGGNEEPLDRDDQSQCQDRSLETVDQPAHERSAKRDPQDEQRHDEAEGVGAVADGRNERLGPGDL